MFFFLSSFQFWGCNKSNVKSRQNDALSVTALLCAPCLQAMVAAGITKDILSAAVSKANLLFRPGHGELLRWVDKHGVPLLMFSAGIAGEGGGVYL